MNAMAKSNLGHALTGGGSAVQVARGHLPGHSVPHLRQVGHFLLLESHDMYLQASTGCFYTCLVELKLLILFILALLSRAFDKHKPYN